jgi:hypothetical protein
MASPKNSKRSLLSFEPEECMVLETEWCRKACSYGFNLLGVKPVIFLIFSAKSRCSAVLDLKKESK